MSDEYLKARQNETVRTATYLIKALRDGPPQSDVGVAISACIYCALEITEAVSKSKIDRDRKLDELVSEIRRAVNQRKRAPFRHMLEKAFGGVANDQ